MSRPRWIAVSLAASVSLSCAARTRTAGSTAPVHIVIAATTDLHGWMEGREETTPDGVKVRQGGLDVLGGYLHNLRQAHAGGVIVLDAGDMFQGTLASNLAEGEPVVKAYAALGYAAIAIGNHEFDYGPVGPSSVAREGGDDPLGALKRNIALAPFPMLLANVTEKASGRRPTWAVPHVLLDVAGVRIGVVGLVTPDTPSVTLPANVESLAFGDPAAAATASAAELRAQGADAVIAVAHLGGGCRDLGDPLDLSSCADDSEAFALARALAPGTIDLLLGGHTHREVRHFVNGIAIAQAGPFGRGLAVVELWVDASADRVIADRTTIRPHTPVCEKVWAGTSTCDVRSAPAGATLVETVFEGRPVRPDAAVSALLAPYLQRVAAKRREPLGVTLAAPFKRPERPAESALGNLVADALRQAVPGADLGITNSGGLRASLTGPELTYGDVFEVLPFDNVAAAVELTGTQLRELVRRGTNGGHGIFQFSGLRVVVDAAKDAALAADERDRVVEVTLTDGSPLEADRVYTVAMNDFLASGGDGLRPLMATLSQGRIRVLHERGSLRDIVIAYLRRRAAAGPLRPEAEGRLIVQNDTAPGAGR